MLFFHPLVAENVSVLDSGLISIQSGADYHRGTDIECAVITGDSLNITDLSIEGSCQSSVQYSAARVLYINSAGSNSYQSHSNYYCSGISNISTIKISIG